MDAAGNWLKPAQAQPGPAWAMCWPAMRPAAGPWLLLRRGLLLRSGLLLRRGLLVRKELELATNLSQKTGLD